MKTEITFGIEFEPYKSATRTRHGLFESDYPIPGAGLVDLTLCANPTFIRKSQHWQAIAIPSDLGLIFECLALDELHAVKQIRQWLDEHNLCMAGIGALHLASQHDPNGWLRAIAEIPLCSETPGIAAKDDPKEAGRILLARKMVNEF